MMKGNIWAVTFALFLGGCESSSSSKKINAYFDVAGLFKAQASLVQNVAFEKTASIDDQREQKILKFDSLAWTKELSMFINMDINKAVLVGAFEEVQSSTAQGKSITYTKKPGVDQGVQWIKLEYDSLGSVITFVGMFEEDNALYQNRRELSAIFAANHGEPMIRQYRIKGYQKILMKDTVNYQVEAKAVN